MREVTAAAQENAKALNAAHAVRARRRDRPGRDAQADRLDARRGRPRRAGAGKELRRHLVAPAATAEQVTFESTAGRWVLAIAVLGSGMAFLDGTVVNVALPDIGRDLGRIDERRCSGSSTATC